MINYLNIFLLMETFILTFFKVTCCLMCLFECPTHRLGIRAVKIVIQSLHVSVKEKHTDENIFISGGKAMKMH